MDYRFFRLNCIFRAILLAATIFVFVYLLTSSSLYATAMLAGAAVVIQILALIFYIERTNRTLARFLSSIKYSDFSQSFSPGIKGSSFNTLNDAMSEVITEFQRARSEREEQYRYLRTVVQHIGLGLLSYDLKGEVDIINTAAKKLLRVTQLKNIKTLEFLSPKLVDTLFKLNPGEKTLVTVEDEAETLRLSIYATGFKLRNRMITLVSIQNIESELAEQEMEAWQKLIRVLTHEIMNSVTPISSLASTANNLIAEIKSSDGHESIELESETLDDIHQAVSTIEKRSRGLLHFIDAYRNLTRIPTPTFEVFPVETMLCRIGQLMDEQLKSNFIDFSIDIEPKSLEMTADRELVEQVLINLMVNAIQALINVDDRRIELASCMDDRGRVLITVTDNGPGIPDSVKAKIFTPFFTTKKEGSGIGLSLSRQIMRLHKGNLTVQSTPNRKTTFTLRF
jgi:two-component system nitrogen regulation sensor histidine kinase NtrY